MNPLLNMSKNCIVGCLLVAGLLFAPILVSGQQVLPLDINQAVEMAMEKNPTMQISRLEIESKNVGISETKGLLLPSFNISGSYNRNIKKPVFFLPEGSPFGTVLEVGSDNSYMAVLSASMPVYNPAINASLEAARAERQLAGEQLRANKLELTYTVQRAFFDALLARESRIVMQESFDNAFDNLQNIRQMHQQGLVAEFDLIRAQVQAENLRPGLLQARNAYEMAVNYLKAVVGLEESQPIELTGNLHDLSSNMLDQFVAAEAHRYLTRNTDLVQLGLQQELLQRQTSAVRASGLPSLALAGNYMYQTEANTFNFGDYNWVNTFSAGIQVSIPLFRGFTIKNQARQLEIASRQLSLQKDYMQDNLRIQLENILNSMSVAIEQSHNARQNVELAIRGYQIALRRYETGQGTLLEVNDSQVALTQARFNLLQAKHEMLQAKIEYDRFTGNNQ